jgi:hypothetical protein
MQHTHLKFRVAFVNSHLSFDCQGLRPSIANSGRVKVRPKLLGKVKHLDEL